MQVELSVLLRGSGGSRGSRSRGFRGVGQLASRFDDLLGKVIRDMGPVPAHREISRAQQLLLAIAQRVADGLLNLRIIDAAQPRGFACDKFQDADAVLQDDRLTDLPGLQREHGLLQGGVRLIQS